MKDFFTGVFGAITACALIFTGVVGYSFYMRQNTVPVDDRSVVSAAYHEPVIVAAPTPTATVPTATAPTTTVPDSPVVPDTQTYESQEPILPDIHAAQSPQPVVEEAVPVAVPDETEAFVRSILDQLFTTYDLEITGNQYYIYYWDDEITETLERGNYTYDSWAALQQSLIDTTLALQDYLTSAYGYGTAIIDLTSSASHEKSYMIVCDGQVDYSFFTGWDPWTIEESKGYSNNFHLYNDPAKQEVEAAYVLNTSTMKVHHPYCSSVADIKSENYAVSDLPISDLIAQGYTTCLKREEGSFK